METSKCKRCGNPVEDMYSKWNYCNRCGSYKQRWDSFAVGFRGLVVGTGLLLVVFLVMSNWISSFALYSLISWLVIFFCLGVFGYAFSRSKYKQ